jgi:hypothetical protein
MTNVSPRFMRVTPRKVSGTVAQLVDDRTLVFTATGTLNLLPSADQPGHRITVVNASTATVNVSPDGTDTIDGSTSATSLTTQYSHLTIESDGAGAWFTVG